jgi:hypothetical protein
VAAFANIPAVRRAKLALSKRALVQAARTVSSNGVADRSACEDLNTVPPLDRREISKPSFSYFTDIARHFVEMCRPSTAAAAEDIDVRVASRQHSRAMPQIDRIAVL